MTELSPGIVPTTMPATTPTTMTRRIHGSSTAAKAAPIRESPSAPTASGSRVRHPGAPCRHSPWASITEAASAW